MAKLVSKTYGEALYEVAMESGEDKAIQLMEEIKGLMAVLNENPDFDRLMKHPGIAKQEKLQLVENVFKGRVSSELEGFLNIVVSKERYGELPGIFAYFIDRRVIVAELILRSETTASGRVTDIDSITTSSLRSSPLLSLMFLFSC